MVTHNFLTFGRDGSGLQRGLIVAAGLMNSDVYAEFKSSLMIDLFGSCDELLLAIAVLICILIETPKLNG